MKPPSRRLLGAARCGRRVGRAAPGNVAAAARNPSVAQLALRYHGSGRVRTPPLGAGALRRWRGGTGGCRGSSQELRALLRRRGAAVVGQHVVVWSTQTRNTSLSLQRGGPRHFPRWECAPRCRPARAPCGGCHPFFLSCPFSEEGASSRAGLRPQATTRQISSNLISQSTNTSAARPTNSKRTSLVHSQVSVARHN